MKEKANNHQVIVACQTGNATTIDAVAEPNTLPCHSVSLLSLSTSLAGKSDDSSFHQLSTSITRCISHSPVDLIHVASLQMARSIPDSLRRYLAAMTSLTTTLPITLFTIMLLNATGLATVISLGTEYNVAQKELASIRGGKAWIKVILIGLLLKIIRDVRRERKEERRIQEERQRFAAMANEKEREMRLWVERHFVRR